jgi:hypothetical protein
MTGLECIRCNPGPCGNRCEKKSLTNAEHIREMTDEELAVFLCLQGWLMDEQRDCLDWLKQPYEGGEDNE